VLPRVARRISDYDGRRTIKIVHATSVPSVPLVKFLFCLTISALAVPAAAQMLPQELLDLLKPKTSQAPPKPADKPAPPKPMETATIAGLTVAVWMPPDATPRPLPVILFSHGFRGCNTQSSFLMRAFAAAGYVVLAPNHRDATCGKLAQARGPEELFARPNAWTDHSYEDRRNDLETLIDTLRKQVPWSSLIDWSKLGLAGQSLGGYTVLGLAGGWESWRLPEIKAVLALAPFCEPFARHGALDRVTAAVMYQGGSADLLVTPSLRRPGGCYDKTPAPVYFVELRQADQLAWTDLQPRFHATVTHYGVGFFDAYLKGGAATALRQRFGDALDVRAK
jgi:predicted dienelactone hydrolase